MFWYIDPSHSQVNFSVKHMMVSTVRGRLGKLSGRLELDPKAPEKGSCEVSVDVGGISLVPTTGLPLVAPWRYDSSDGTWHVLAASYTP